MRSVSEVWSEVGGYSYYLKHVLACLTLFLCLYLYVPPIYVLLDLIRDGYCSLITQPHIHHLLEDNQELNKSIKMYCSAGAGGRRADRVPGMADETAFNSLWLDDVTSGKDIAVLICYMTVPFLLIQVILYVISFVTCPMFEAEPTLRYSPKASSTPYLCIRVNTKGSFADLVTTTVRNNASTCLQLGMPPLKFRIEVITLTDLNLLTAIETMEEDEPVRQVHVREIVVPGEYSPPNGSMFKCRNLQYGLEPDVDELSDGDYILYLDEETLLRPSSLTACINSMCEGELDFGQGLVTYSKYGRMNSLWATLCDTLRVSTYLGSWLSPPNASSVITHVTPPVQQPIQIMSGFKPRILS